MKLLSILCLAFLCLNATAEVDGSKVEEKLNQQQKDKIKSSYLKSTDDAELALKLFRLDLAPYIKTLDRDIVTYNYRAPNEFSDKPVTDLTTDSPSAIAYANKWGAASKKLIPSETGMYGWGLYTSRDPLSSESYGTGVDYHGKLTFNMVTVKFEKGDKLLDIRKIGSDLPMSKETADAFRKVCPSFQVYGEIVNKVSFNSDPKCHDIYIKALESFNVQAVIYNWQQTASSLCPDNDSGPAFVTINQKLDAHSIDYFTKLPDNVLEEAKKIQGEKNAKKRKMAQHKFSLGLATFKAYEKMAAIRAKFQPRSDSAPAFSPFLSPDPAVNADYEKEFAEHNFDCTKAHDDKETYKPDQRWDVLLQDTKLIQTLDKGLKAILNNCQEQ